MPEEQERALPTGVWLNELRRLSDSCVEDDGRAEDRAVRRAFHCLKLSPPSIARMWDSDLSESRLEDLLDRHEASQAACEIIGGRAGVKLSPAGDAHRHIAELRFDDEHPVFAEAATPALAMISAWAQLLSAPRSNASGSGA